MYVVFTGAGVLHLLHHDGPVAGLPAAVQQPEAAGGPERVDPRPARGHLVPSAHLPEHQVKDKVQSGRLHYQSSPQ